MNYEVEILPDAPVLLGTWYEGFKFAEDGPAFAGEVHTLLNAQQTPVFYVLDMSQLETISVEGIVKAAQSASKGPNYTHPMNRGNIIVSEKAIVEMSVEGLKSPTFGNLDVELFATIEEALEYVKNES